MAFLEQNLAALARRQPALASLLSSVTSDCIEMVTSRKGLPSCFYRRAVGDPVPLHSRFDPLQEARQSMEQLDLTDPDYIIFLGFGLGYGLDVLLERAARDRIHIFVVESDLEILRAAFAARDLTSHLSLPHIHFAWPVEGNELGRQWERFFDLVRARNSIFVSHAPSLVLNPELFRSAASVIQGKTLQVFADINSVIANVQSFLDNFAANFQCASAAPGVSEFAGAFTGKPAFLVSAGPSLDRNIHELRAVRNQALILATDTSLKPLVANGIEPDIVLSGDPRHENYLHLEGTGTRRTLLVTEATAHPGVFGVFEGRTVVCTFENSSLATLSAILSAKGTLRSWGSVATMCLDFALFAGCNPIIFVGQDLAYSDGRTYCTGLHWDQARFAGVCNPVDWEKRWAALRSGYNIIVAEDIFGRPVESIDKLVAYWNWISNEIDKHPDVRFINATEGGILKRNVEIMSLREAVFRFCTRGADLRAIVQDRFADAVRRKPCADWTILASLQEESRKLPALLEHGLQLCDQAGSSWPLREWVSRLDEAHRSVLKLTHLMPLLDSCNQLGNIAFMRRRHPSSAPIGPDLTVDELRETYRDYFQSLERARQMVLGCLERLPRA